MMDTDNNRLETSKRRGIPRLFRAVAAAVLGAALSAGCGGNGAEAPGDGADTPLVAAMMPEIPPYSYLDPDTGKPAGIDVEIVRAAAAKLGRPLEIRPMPFAGVLPAVKNGEADFAIAAITITEGRSRDADFSDPYAEEGCAFLYRAGTQPPTMIRAKELAMAADIQENAIPRVFPPFPEEKRMDLFASMKPARDVGGDFYDFFYSGADRLVFLVADVSGKGVPAALFMMRAKTVPKNLAQTGRPLADAVTEANEALCEGNAANMFVTAWIGELDLATGAVSYVNAGHNPPVRFGQDAAPEFVRGRSGLMLGAMPGLSYQARQMRLSPGQMLYLYTDGMTEQPDAKGALFGEKRLCAAIAAGLADGRPLLERGASPLLDALHAAVLAHGGPVEQADDCTQLLIRWNGPVSKAGTA